MSMKYNDLIKMSEEELIRAYDQTAEHTSVGLNYYSAEIVRRSNEKMNRTMVRLTWVITIMTTIMLACTVINIFLTRGI